MLCIGGRGIPDPGVRSFKLFTCTPPKDIAYVAFPMEVRSYFGPSSQGDWGNHPCFLMAALLRVMYERQASWEAPPSKPGFQEKWARGTNQRKPPIVQKKVQTKRKSKMKRKWSLPPNRQAAGSQGVPKAKKATHRAKWKQSLPQKRRAAGSLSFKRNHKPKTNQRSGHYGEVRADASISAWLESVLQKALQSAVWRPGQVYLALFAGTDPIGTFIKAKGGAVIRFELEEDSRFDLTRPEVQQTVLKWIRLGIAWATFLGTHCRTWSTASYSKGPGWLNSYRTKSHLWGRLDKLTRKAQVLVSLGNEHARFSIEVLQCVAQQPLAVGGMENPAGSVIWRLPEMQSLQNQWPRKMFLGTCDYCQYGKPWKKRTTVLWVGVNTTLAPQRLCSPRQQGHCSRTGRPHWKLGQGRCHPKSGKPLTRLAEPYPKPLAKEFADCLTGSCRQP